MCIFGIVGRFSENINEAVSHKANLTIKSAEIRLDYMGSCIIMTSLSLFKVKLDNEWPFKLTESPRHDSGGTVYLFSLSCSLYTSI